MKLSWLFVIFLLIGVAVFSVQNADMMTVRFLGWQFDMSAALVIQLAALLGALVGLVIGARSGRKPRAVAPPTTRPPELLVEPASPRPETDASR